MIETYGIVDVSGNRKTGPVVVTRTSEETCPDECPFKGKGCYGDNLHARMAWDKVTNGTAKKCGDFNWFIRAIRAMPPSIIRHNEVGDLPMT